MRIKKKLNNNIVVAVNEMGMEYVLTGKGIAFDKKKGERIQLHDAEKVFTTQGRGVAEKLSKIIQDIPLDYVKVCDEIINMAKQKLTEEVNENIYLTLIDHVSFAIERHIAGVGISTLLQWEIKKIAPEEYAVGLQALDIIQKRLNIRLPDAEAVYIAFHFINAKTKEDGYTEETVRFTGKVIAIVKQYFDIEINPDSISYSRFIIHLQYLARRIFKQEEAIKNVFQTSLYKDFRDELEETTHCMQEIETLILNSYQYSLDENEKMYLLIHLRNLLAKQFIKGGKKNG